MRLHRLLLPLIACLVLLTGCATPSMTSSNRYDNSQAMGMQQVYFGRVESVRNVDISRDTSQPGMGAVLGAVIGGVVGNQIGSGTGRALATVGGAVAGGFAGNSIQNHESQKAGLEITVRLDNGQRVAVVQDADVPFYPGDRVRIVGYGNSARVVRN
jgi:outer membrane lipoprotein SlyB